MKVIGFVTPAQAGVHVPTNWIPAFALRPKAFGRRVAGTT
jgi:hypothetical protein